MSQKPDDNHEKPRPEEPTVFQIIILVLSLVLLGMLAVNTAFNLPPDISDALQTIDTIVCFLLLFDFVVRFRKAPSKMQFMKWGWIDLLSSIPNLSGIPYLSHLRWGRLVRVFQIIRLIRALRASHKITNILLKDRFQTGAAAIILLSILFLIFSTLGILICERNNPSANIRTVGDALWWSVATLTTANAGNEYPVTAAGRCLGMMMTLSGVGLFGGLSGLAASFFIGAKDKKIVAEESKILARLEQIEHKIDRLKNE
ncbi:MAG TPA: ion transporter [Verrucomicrobiae bacterium]|jgi:voltage-gated potassium channel